MDMPYSVQVASSTSQTDAWPDTDRSCSWLPYIKRGGANMPQRWQHHYFIKISEPMTGKNLNLDGALVEAYEEANKLGADGWEMFSLHTHFVSGSQAQTMGAKGRGGSWFWVVQCHMKRPY